MNLVNMSTTFHQPITVIGRELGFMNLVNVFMVLQSRLNYNSVFWILHNCTTYSMIMTDNVIVSQQNL